MRRENRAFTLIELLVVIAIIAILAAILFPVFAEAKNAAKKTAAISNAKQNGQAIAIYTTDSDDVYPRAVGFFPGVGTMFGYAHDVPEDWFNGTLSNNYLEFARGVWANNTQPYRKNFDMLNTPGTQTRNYFNDNFNTVRRQPAILAFSMNGLLHSFSATAVNAPSSLALLWQADGTFGRQGYATANPSLNCPQASQPCSYVPPSATCSGANGQWSVIYGTGTYPNNASQWLYGRGSTQVHADTSARFVRRGMNTRQRGSTVRTLTDFRTDPWFNYDTTGRNNNSQWQDPLFCHSLLFMPDFDFQNWGTPYPWG